MDRISAAFESISDEFIAKSPDISAHGNKVGRKMKATCGILIPSEDVLCFGSYVKCGDVDAGYKFSGYKNRQEIVGRQIWEMYNIPHPGDPFQVVNDFIQEHYPKSGIIPGVPWCDEDQVGIGSIFRLVIDGKICFVSSAIPLYEKPDITPGSEFDCARRYLEAFREEILPTRAMLHFAQAHLREFIAVDYPRKFVWHSSLVKEKNTFLEFETPEIDETLPHRTNHEIDDDDDQEQIYEGMKSVFTSSIPEFLLRDIKRPEHRFYRCARKKRLLTIQSDKTTVTPSPSTSSRPFPRGQAAHERRHTITMCAAFLPSPDRPNFFPELCAHPAENSNHHVVLDDGSNLNSDIEEGESDTSPDDVISGKSTDPNTADKRKRNRKGAPYFRQGDRVQLHSFEKTRYLDGLTARVKKVYTENRVNGPNRARVQIMYDDPAINKNKNYPSTIPLRYLRHI